MEKMVEMRISLMYRNLGFAKGQAGLMQHVRALAPPMRAGQASGALVGPGWGRGRTETRGIG